MIKAKSSSVPAGFAVNGKCVLYQAPGSIDASQQMAIVLTTPTTSGPPVRNVNRITTVGIGDIQKVKVRLQVEVNATVQHFGRTQ